MAMDPVSRRLAAAAMGLAFGLSRDEELEKTRLDLERARMEREDFRNGAGPDTSFMHWQVERLFVTTYEESYKERMTERYSMRKMDDVRLEEHKDTARDMFNARSLLAKVLRERQKLNEPTVNEIVQHFREADINDEELVYYAGDGIGEVFLGLSVSSDDEDIEDISMSED